MQPRTVDVDAFVDEQKITGFNWFLVFWCFVITLIDGYDISAAPAAGPFFMRAWGLASPAALTFAFSATNFGVLFGAPLFGWIGDRYGRKPAIIASLIAFGLFTMLVALATSVEHLTWARFLTGFGVGGVIANTIALNAEMAPRRVRATFIILMFIGNTLGGIFPPIVANTLVPAHGWQIIFWIGGVLPLVIAAMSVFVLPESIKFLSLTTERRVAAARLARRMRLDAPLGSDDMFVSSDQGRAKARLADLFAGRLSVMTPLLWLLFAINLMVFYFVNTWMQTIITPLSWRPAARLDRAKRRADVPARRFDLRARDVPLRRPPRAASRSSACRARHPLDRHDRLLRDLVRAGVDRLRLPGSVCSECSSGSTLSPGCSIRRTCVRSASAMRSGSDDSARLAARLSAAC